MTIRVKLTMRCSNSSPRNGRVKRACCNIKFAFRITNNNRATFLHSSNSPRTCPKNIFCVHHFFNLQNINLFIIKRRVAWLRRIQTYDTKNYNFPSRKTDFRSIHCPSSSIVGCKILISDGTHKKIESVKLLE